MKYYLIAGEASGDLHASNLMKALKETDPKSEFRFWGGQLMQAQGGTMVHHYKELAFMGFWEVLKNIRKLSKYIKQCKQDILDTQPDAVILVDYAGFNLRIAQFAHENGLQVFYYIAPKVWAWNEKRVQKIKKYVNHLYIIFPFEKDYFEQKHQYPVHYFGNPLQDEITHFQSVDEQVFREKYQLSPKPIIALLPGSRSQEIHYMLPVMAEMPNFFPEYQFVIAGAPHRNFEFYQPYIRHHDVGFVSNDTYQLLSLAEAALVTSGTATLETALFNVPQVVCYRSSVASYYIAKSLVKDLKYISLVNLIMDKSIVTELIQHQFNTENLKRELTQILQPEYRSQMLENYATLHRILGNSGASEGVAQHIYKSLEKV